MAINPHAELVEQAVQTWAQRFSIGGATLPTSTRAARVGWLVSWAYPCAPLDVLQIVADLSLWLLIWDDAADQPGFGDRPERFAAAHARFLQVLRGGASASASPMEQALADIRLRLMARMPQVWMEQFVVVIEQIFDAWEWEAGNRASRRIPELMPYLHRRAISGGLPLYLGLLELTDQLTVPSDPKIQRLTNLAMNIIAWANELESFEKEYAQGEIHNLIIVLMHQQQLDQAAATQRVIAMYNESVTAFMELQQEIELSLQPDSQRYIAQLVAWMHTNARWLRSAERYR